MKSADQTKCAIAIAAHPDDIEFVMAGTLLLLQQRGWEIHYFNLSSGNCGSVRYNAPTTRRKRLAEAKSAAKLLGSHFHPPIADDLEIFYNEKLLRRVAAVIREVKPSIVLTHSPQDYMEDHMNTSRLAVTAAFSRGMPNFVTTPRRKPVDDDVTVYHAMPHGLCDGLRQSITPDAFVNTISVHDTKVAALAEHRSQQEWLDVSQGMNSYVRAMDEMSREVGRMSRRFKHAEGWRRHLHLGLCAKDANPLRGALGRDYLQR
ncbi:MAG TPA: PIG-L family deacetylase [Candidatus Acidoferrum sp.]|nr:PIG-L family deacetylase [Candidatus Acidoferrum sp.]